MSLARTARSVNKYRDYLSWSGENRVEIIEGEVYDMSPAPSKRHQTISTNLIGQLFHQVSGTGRRIFHAPFDVRLPESGESDDDCTTVVQPDIVIVCDPDKLDDRGCRGAPDLVIEITSPSSASVDNITKLELYEKHGVREYWIVHPVDNIAMRRVLGKEHRYGLPEIYNAEADVNVTILPDVVIELKKIFE